MPATLSTLRLWIGSTSSATLAQKHRSDSVYTRSKKYLETLNKKRKKEIKKERKKEGKKERKKERKDSEK
jgi:predicted N-acyltransferase